MTTDELKQEHFELDPYHYLTGHANISLQFAIELLEGLRSNYGFRDTPMIFVNDKINELEKLKI